MAAQDGVSVSVTTRGGCGSNGTRETMNPSKTNVCGTRIRRRLHVHHYNDRRRRASIDCRYQEYLRSLRCMFNLTPVPNKRD